MQSFLSTFSHAVTSDDILILAISGWVDSMVLLDLVMDIHPKQKIIVAHFDHTLRARESDGDRELVEQVALNEGIVFVYEKKDIGKLAYDEKISLEAVARRERYDFLQRIATEYGARYILTAHHRDDQAETVLLNMLKWGKIRGLSGMSLLSGDILRPLLSIPKSTLMEYAREQSVSYREDSSNHDTTYERNTLRHNIIPLLQEINPSLDKTLAELASYMQNIAWFMDSHVARWCTDASRESGREYSFFRSTFVHETLFFQKEILAYLYRQAHDGSTQSLSRGNIDEMIRFITHASNSHGVREIKKLMLERRGERVFYHRDTPET